MCSSLCEKILVHFKKVARKYHLEAIERDLIVILEVIKEMNQNSACYKLFNFFISLTLLEVRSTKNCGELIMNEILENELLNTIDLLERMLASTKLSFYV